VAPARCSQLWLLLCQCMLLAAMSMSIPPRSSQKKAATRGLADRLKALATGPGSDHATLPFRSDNSSAVSSAVFPRSRPRPMRGSEVDMAASSIIMTGSGRRLSSIDGLPLPPAREPPRRGSARSRSKSHGRPADGSSSSTSRAGGRARGALYFVDAFSHRTLARCAACDNSLTDDGEAGRRSPCVLGFRPATALRDGSQVSWVHASRACLRKLALPGIAHEHRSEDIVFSRSVSLAQQAEVLENLVGDIGSAAAGDCDGTTIRRTLRVLRWSFAAANPTHWRRLPSTGAPRGGGCSAAGTASAAADFVLRGTTKLEKGLLERMAASSGAAPLCIICMQDLVVDEPVIRLRCSHVFHASCATEWLRRKPVCPLDLTAIFEPEHG